MKFWCMSNAREKPKEESDAGSKTRVTFRWGLSDTGEKVLLKDKEYSIKDEINSYRDECDIKNIVAKASFDPSFAQALVDSAEMDIDTTEWPDNIHDMKKMSDNTAQLIEKAKAESEATKNTQNEPIKEEKTNEPE